MTSKIPIAILGATGTVGQRMVALLADHPWFQIAQLAASEKSVGKPYMEAVNWLLDTPIPKAVRSMCVTSCIPLPQIRLALSALDTEPAKTIEPEWVNKGIVVVSNASAHRMNEEVPLLIPEVNPDHLALVAKQGEKGQGFLVTNPNCVTIGLCLALKPLVDRFGIREVAITSFQSVSGAGFPGVASLRILDNLIPYISNEEPKVETEPKKIFGSVKKEGIDFAPFQLSATCVRVPVTEGHLKAVSVRLDREAQEEDILQAWNGFHSPIQSLRLPLSPEKVIEYEKQSDFPQPRFDRLRGHGMTVSIGRLRHCPLMGWKFVVLSHNTIRGAAGGSILIAELLAKKGYVRGR